MKKRFVLISILLLAAVAATAMLSGCTAVKEDFSPAAADEEYKNQVMSSSVAYEYLEWLGGEDMRSRYGSVDSDGLNIN